MNNKIALGIGSLIVLVGGYYIWTQNFSEDVNLLSSPEPQLESSPVPIDAVNPTNIEKFGSKNIVHTDGTGTITISFKDPVTQARNPGSLLFINDTKVSQVEGQGVLDWKFSPDSNYFAFRTLSVCGIVCLDTQLYLINISEKILIAVPTPRKEEEYLGDTSSYVDNEAIPFIESYSYNGNMLEIVFFFTGVSKNDGKTYRLSEKETWKYDLESREYINLQ